MWQRESSEGDPKFPRTSAVAFVADFLRRKIISGELAPDDWLRQDAIAEELGVSRMPLREALRHLESEGYVVCHANRGWAIAALSADDVEEIYVMRAALEGFAARIATSHVVDPEIDQMDVLLQNMERLRASEDSGGFLVPDFEFHDVLYNATGRARLIKRIHVLQQSASRYLNLYIALPGAMDMAIAGHRRILDACRQHDSDLAERCARQHITEIANRVIDHVRRQIGSRSEEVIAALKATK